MEHPVQRQVDILLVVAVDQLKIADQHLQPVLVEQAVEELEELMLVELQEQQALVVEVAEVVLQHLQVLVVAVDLE
jgi:hypothetical protein|tara:strand:- start:144 stop:371 length:228 start_codon:yes stop_codon:yes gene_type:complete